MCLLNTTWTAYYSLKTNSLKTPASVPKLTVSMEFEFRLFKHNEITSEFSGVFNGGKVICSSNLIEHLLLIFFHF